MPTWSYCQSRDLVKFIYKSLLKEASLFVIEGDYSLYSTVCYSELKNHSDIILVYIHMYSSCQFNLSSHLSHSDSPIPEP